MNAGRGCAKGSAKCAGRWIDFTVHGTAESLNAWLTKARPRVRARAGGRRGRPLVSDVGPHACAWDQEAACTTTYRRLVDAFNPRHAPSDPWWLVPPGAPGGPDGRPGGRRPPGGAGPGAPPRAARRPPGAGAPRLVCPRCLGRGGGVCLLGPRSWIARVKDIARTGPPPRAGPPPAPSPLPPRPAAPSHARRRRRSRRALRARRCRSACVASGGASPVARFAGGEVCRSVRFVPICPYLPLYHIRKFPRPSPRIEASPRRDRVAVCVSAVSALPREVTSPVSHSGARLPFRCSPGMCMWGPGQ